MLLWMEETLKLDMIENNQNDTGNQSSLNQCYFITTSFVIQFIVKGEMDVGILNISEGFQHLRHS